MRSLYRYKACNIDGRWIEGELSALNREEALKRLQAAGVYVTSLSSVKRPKWLDGWNPVYVSEQDRIFLLESWAMFLEAGLPMQSALLSLRMRSRSRSVARAIERVQQGLDEGKRLTESLQEAALFPPSWVAILAVGEAQGDFVPLLRMLQAQAVEFRRFKQQIRSMWVMPSILVALVGVWTWLFVSRIVPSFASLLGEAWVLKAVPAWIGSAAGWLANGIRWLPIPLVLLILFSRWNRRADREGWFAASWVPFSTPVLGSLISKIELIRILKGLQLQTAAGIPLVRAIEVLGRSASNRWIRQDLLQAYRKLKEGIPVPEVLARLRIVPLMGQPLLAVGDATGRLPQMLDFLVQDVQADLLERVQRLITLIRSVVILVTGILVGGIVVAYFSLIFSGLSHLPEAIHSGRTTLLSP